MLPDYLAVFANLGSMGGLRALRRDLCHIAASHLLQENGEEYNFEFANREFNQVPVMINFCRRGQGFLLHEVNSHMEVGLEVLSGRADIGPGIRRTDISMMPAGEAGGQSPTRHEVFYIN